MELAPKNNEYYNDIEASEVTLSDETARKLAIVALREALSLNEKSDDYASGNRFPNIPFGD
jgi:translation initiation factor IF-3